MRPLFKAIEAGDADQVKELLASGSDVNYSKNQRTPAHHAVAEGQAECLECVITARADLEATDRQARTPMHIACMTGKTRAHHPQTFGAPLPPERASLL